MIGTYSFFTIDFITGKIILTTGKSNNSNRRLDYAYDPSNFLYSDSYGEAPTGNLTIRYLKGGGIKSNVEANTLTNKFSVPISNAPTLISGPIR